MCDEQPLSTCIPNPSSLICDVPTMTKNPTFAERLNHALEHGRKIGKKKRVSETTAHNYCVAFLYTLPHCTYRQMVLLTRAWYKGFDQERNKEVNISLKSTLDMSHHVPPDYDLILEKGKEAARAKLTEHQSRLQCTAYIYDTYGFTTQLATVDLARIWFSGYDQEKLKLTLEDNPWTVI